MTELVVLLRVLWRRRLAVGLGALTAFGIGLMVASAPGSSVGIGTSRVVLDTERSQLIRSDPAGADSLVWRAQLLADLATSEPVKARIAADAGIASADLHVVEPLLLTPEVATALPRHAAQAAAATTESHVLTVEVHTVLPIISIHTIAPDRAGAYTLAAAAFSALGAGDVPAGTRELQGFVLQSAAPIRTRILTSDNAVLKAAAVSIVLFGLWCAFVATVPTAMASAVAHKTGRLAWNVGDGTSRGVRTAGTATGRGARTAAAATRHGLRTAAAATSHGLRAAAATTSRGARTAAWATTRRLRSAADAGARGLGFDLVKRNFYSPLPDRHRLPASLWSAPSALAGVELDTDRALALLRELSPHLEEFESELLGRGFRLDNGTYESVDAETLYAMLRHFKPARVIELGSGTSSHVIAAALRRNEADGKGAAYQAFDPYPWEATELGPVEGVHVVALGATDIPAVAFEWLRAGDVLFVDTTHTVKTGGDVPHLLLEMIPRLAPGVIVHFHDIFLPYEYPRDWVVDMRLAWAEQYLLQAFLAFNPEFEVLLPVHALARGHADEVHRLVQSFGPGVAPGAFWIRRRH